MPNLSDKEQRPLTDISGLAIWASVSEEVDAKLRDQIKGGAWPVRLKADEWTSGDNPFTLSSTQSFSVFSEAVGGAGVWIELRGLINIYASEEFLKKADEMGLIGFKHRCNFYEI